MLFRSPFNIALSIPKLLDISTISLFELDTALTGMMTTLFQIFHAFSPLFFLLFFSYSFSLFIVWLVFGFIFTFLAEGLVFLLWEAVENRKGAVKPRPLCTPLGLFFRSSWVVVCDTVLTFVCMLRYWMRNVVPRGLQWNCNEVLDVRCTSAEFCNPCGVQQGAAIYAAYAAEVPQPMRHIRPGLRNLYYATIYPTEIYKVPFDTFRLSVELPVQKHTGTS